VTEPSPECFEAICLQIPHKTMKGMLPRKERKFVKTLRQSSSSKSLRRVPEIEFCVEAQTICKCGRSDQLKGRRVWKTLGVFAIIANLISDISAQDWTQSSAPLGNWIGVACSADGTKVAALTTLRGVCFSTNSGVTWQPTTPPTVNWSGGGTSIALSADGRQLVLATASSSSGPFGGPIFISTNAGTAWTMTSATNLAWWGLASTADGTRLAAMSDKGNFSPGLIYTSTNSGQTWTQSSAPEIYWGVIAASADGSKLVAAASGLGRGSICVSADWGVTWTWADPFSSWKDWCSLACSADGTRLAGGTRENGVYTSSDGGLTWTQCFAYGARVACSADYTKLVTASGLGSVYTSTNSGADWTQASVPGMPWSAVGSSADGGRLFATVNGAGIYIGQSIPTPILTIWPSGTGFLLSWIAPSTPFGVQQNPDPASTSWTDLTDIPTLNCTNLRCQLVVPSSSAKGFYRLIAR
jgi:hypothetical protein